MEDAIFLLLRTKWLLFSFFGHVHIRTLYEYCKIKYYYYLIIQVI